ncbi:hypothetical protein D8674_018514 [Pyrus ussuriensis x Pyrus communis]|uniref:Uncharacterized protein n=1 Tax=Pyrus ussuriensis x Pyrus communis TaxID=2448454 RepID=A0A5N5GAM7_9ROSA|nr:hypothetical protein D8674_018514 [Pyrus ussuriensis x Pyrus communis]
MDVSKRGKAPKTDEEKKDERKAWRKKDARALYAIQSFCGDDTYERSLLQAYPAPIDHDDGPTPTDREARPELAMEEGLNAGHESNANDIYATFVKYVKSNDWDKAIHERISSGGTALHYAVRPLNNCSVRNIEQSKQG